jgi:hypothetical protein
MEVVQEKLQLLRSKLDQIPALQQAEVSEKGSKRREPDPRSKEQILFQNDGA